jgi:hypothetical protein
MTITIQQFIIEFIQSLSVGVLLLLVIDQTNDNKWYFINTTTNATNAINAIITTTISNMAVCYV